MIDELTPYNSYRSAVLPWVPRLPSHWRTERAKWLFDRMDRPVRPQDDVVTCFRDGMVTLRKNRRLRGFTEAIFEFGYQGIRRGDLVIHAMDAFAGAVGVSDSDGKGTPVYAVCQPRTGIVSHYYAHVVRQMAHSQWILALSRGIRERSTDFRFEMFGNQWLPLPPPDDQTAIVRFLDHANRRIDRFIRAKRKLIALLNEQKQAIIHGAVTRGLDPNVPMKTSGLANCREFLAPASIPWLASIPKHWSLLPAKRIFTPRKDLARSSDVQLSATQAYGVIPQAEFEQKVGRRVVKVLLHLDKRRHVEKDDFVISMRSFQGGLERAWASGCIRSSYVVLTPTMDIDVGYFAYLFKSRGYIQALQATSNFIRDGQDLNFRNFCLVDLPVVPLKEQKAIADFLDQATASLDAPINRARKELDLLQEYRTRLVADVVTGQLDVREAAARLPADEPEAAVEELASEADQEEDGEPEEMAE